MLPSRALDDTFCRTKTSFSLRTVVSFLSILSMHTSQRPDYRQASGTLSMAAICLVAGSARFELHPTSLFEALNMTSTVTFS